MLERDGLKAKLAAAEEKISTLEQRVAELENGDEMRAMVKDLHAKLVRE